MTGQASAAGLTRGGFALLCLLVVAWGGFSLFVGFSKATLPLDQLRLHEAWTWHLPETLGRVIGWLELLAAAVMMAGLARLPLRRWAALAAGWITLNHAVAAVIHVRFAEWAMLPLSALYIATGLVIVWLFHRLARG